MGPNFEKTKIRFGWSPGTQGFIDLRNSREPV
jgi:hypothetical protein